MPSLKEKENKEQLLTDGANHAAAAVMGEERVGGDDNNQRSVVGDSGITTSAVSNNTSKSIVDDITDGNAKVDEEVKDSDATMEELEEQHMGGRATTTRSSSTNEENSTISSKELFTRSDNGTEESHLFDIEAKGQGADAAVEDVSGEEEGKNHDYHASALGLGKYNESALQLDETGNDSNQQRIQYNQSFLSSSSQSNETFTRSSRKNEKQDEYVKQGARVKALLASALQAVADGLATRAGNSVSNNNNDNGDDGVDAEKNSAKSDADFVHLQDLAQKKSEECITLKRVSSCSYELGVLCLLAFNLTLYHTFCHSRNRNLKSVSCKSNAFIMNVPHRNKIPTKLNPRLIVRSKHSRLPVRMPLMLVPKLMLPMHVLNHSMNK